MRRYSRHIIFLLVLLESGAILASDTLLYDSTKVAVRQFSQEDLTNYREQEAFQYVKIENKTDWTWWERLKYEVMRFLFGQTPSGKIFQRVVLWALAIFAVSLIAIGLMKIPLRKLWNPHTAQLNIGFEELEENIHEMDFDQLIQQAIQDKAYRRGVRLLYLETLKELTSHEWIQWKINKTNFDYQEELRHTPLIHDFESLTLDYEYVWYGDFPVNESGFNSMRKTFQQFQAAVRRS